MKIKFTAMMVMMDCMHRLYTIDETIRTGTIVTIIAVNLSIKWLVLIEGGSIQSMKNNLANPRQ